MHCSMEELASKQLLAGDSHHQHHTEPPQCTASLLLNTSYMKSVQSPPPLDHTCDQCHRT